MDANMQAQTVIETQEAKYLEISWERILVLWWAIVWRTTVFGMILGAFLGFTGGLLAALSGRPDLGTIAGTLLAWLGSIPLSIVILRLVLRKKFGEFSVRLIRNG